MQRERKRAFFEHAIRLGYKHKKRVKIYYDDISVVKIYFFYIPIVYAL